MNLSTPFSVLRTNVVVSAAAIVFLSTLGTISDAHAKITAFFSAGVTYSF